MSHAGAVAGTGVAVNAGQDGDGPNLRIAADIGGTFTDVTLVGEDGVIATRKVLSTPDDYSRAVVEGIGQLLEVLRVPAGLVSEVLHGCTVATNAILERKGARTALITTKGFRDVLELRRIRVPTLYDPLYVKPTPLVPRRLRLEVEERLDGRGEVVTPLNVDDAMRAVETIRESGAEAVAVTLLHSYANGEHERRIGEILRRELPGCFVSLSVELLPEIREYERTSTAVINAYVGPPVRRYVESLVDRMRESGIPGRLMMMQSNGGTIDAATAMSKPAEIVECGPAAGVIGAAHMGRRMDCENIITLDMGGTTAKASLIEGGRLSRTDEYEVGGGISLSSRLVKGGGYALKIPVIDISEVGAGGGSIVWLDKVGQIKIGPESAGAVPGPVCYDNGGTEPTVTDANVVLGYLNPTALAGGSVRIDAARAREALARRLGKANGGDLLRAAYGVHTIANANMVRAVKAVSTYRGRDPREFALFAFGGSGGVHAAELARALQIRRVVVPMAAGVFSALGLLVAETELGVSGGFLRPVDEISPGEIAASYGRLERQILEQFDCARDAITFRHFADMRYVGQAFELVVPVPPPPLDSAAIAGLADAFEDEHEATYGHRYPGKKAVQVVSLRVTGTVATDSDPAMDATATRSRAAAPQGPSGERTAWFGPDFGEMTTPVLSRAVLTATPREGPLVIEEYEGTVVVPPAARASLDEWGNIDIEIDMDPASGEG